MQAPVPQELDRGPDPSCRGHEHPAKCPVVWHCQAAIVVAVAFPLFHVWGGYVVYMCTCTHEGCAHAIWVPLLQIHGCATLGLWASSATMSKKDLRGVRKDGLCISASAEQPKDNGFAR